MKAKLTYILFASALLFSSACQKEYTDINGSKNLSFSVSLADAGTKVDTKSGNVIFTDENGNQAPFTINLSVEDTKVEPLTKGIPITSKKDFETYVQSFRVWGWYGSTAWAGLTNAEIRQVVANGDEYRPFADGNFVNAYNSDATTTSNYHFYAHFPYNLTDTGASLSGSPTVNNGMSFSYTMPGGAGGTADAELQKEVLAGYLGTGANMASVPITFTPILAAIRFQVGEHMDHDITIKSIELKNFYYTGSCVVKAGADPVVKWTTTTDSKRNFKQDFDKAIQTGANGTEINEANLSKTFFIVPQTCSSEMSNAGEKQGAMMVITYSEVIDGVTHDNLEAQHLVFGNTFEAGKTYIYKIGKFDDDPDDLEPWVDFSNFEVNFPRLLGGNNRISIENNSKFIFDFAQDGGAYEKAYFKIHNLEVGEWYSIEFTENLSLVNSTDKTFGNVGTYACRVDEAQNKGTTMPTMLAYYSGAGVLAEPPFIWEHPDNIYNNTNYTSLQSKGETAKLTFKATAQEMWWQWDYSRGHDDRKLKAEIYLPEHSIQKITPASGVATVDFLNATIYNCTTSGGNYGNSSMKTYAIDATGGAAPASGTLVFRVVNSGFGRMNIPLTNLDPAKRYRINYTIDKKGTKSNRTGNNYGLGYLIQGSANTNNNTFNPTTNANYTSFKGTYTSQTNFNFTESFEFSPTASTMYWVWDFSEFATGNSDHQFVTFSDVTIEEVTP